MDLALIGAEGVGRMDATVPQVFIFIFFLISENLLLNQVFISIEIWDIILNFTHRLEEMGYYFYFELLFIYKLTLFFFFFLMNKGRIT